ncbi:alcohol dehydrogenase catalytic domain-containing protein [Streptomyces griseoincarnatus]
MLATHLVFEETGGPEVLRLQQREMRNSVPGEVLVKVGAIGVNRAEVQFRRGTYFGQPSLPSSLGYEVAGVIEAVGEDVSAFAPRDTADLVPAARPPDISPRASAAVWMVYLTAYGTLVEDAALEPGAHVLISAASSSVGLVAIQTARRIGAVLSVTTRTAARQRLLAASATHGTDDDDLPARGGSIIGGHGFRRAIDPVAGPGIEILAQAVGSDGYLLVYGTLDSRPTPPPRANLPCVADPYVHCLRDHERSRTSAPRGRVRQLRPGHGLFPSRHRQGLQPRRRRRGSPLHGVEHTGRQDRLTVRH